MEKSLAQSHTDFQAEYKFQLGAVWLCPAALMGLCHLLRWYRERQVVSHLWDKYVFITGCDSGFGNLLARQLDLRGLRVLAACLTEKGAQQLRKQMSDRLETVIPDVTRTESIAAATQWVKERLGAEIHPDFFCVCLFLLSEQEELSSAHWEDPEDALIFKALPFP
nr:17-beta-hydroxysteroid dehydrogenase type 6-like [Vicugna pacos]